MRISYLTLQLISTQSILSANIVGTAPTGSLTGTGHDGLITVMGKMVDYRELRRLEQLCLEQAELCSTTDGSIGLRALAAQYRTAAEAIVPNRPDHSCLSGRGRTAGT